MTETLPPRERVDPPAPRGPRLPDIPGPVETLGLAWRRLRKMSTALVLLFALALASVVATFVPQEPVIARTVELWRAGTAGPGAAWARVLDALSFFDVFGSWWFLAITAALFTSLTGCLFPRYRAFARVVRRPPAPGRGLDRLAHHEVLRTALPPTAALDAAETVLGRYRRRRVEAVDGVAQIAAERGHWREGGSLVFHTAFYLLLVGIVIGHSFGFTGQINVAEGSDFADTTVVYDQAKPGRFWDAGDHRGFVVRLDDFDVSYHPDFTPKDFVSTVTILEDGQEVRTTQVRVNHPLVYRGMKIFQARFGMAPRVVVRPAGGGDALFDDRVLLTQDGPFWVGRAKVSAGNPSPGDGRDPVPQIALDLALVPDAAIVDGELRINSPEPRNPRLAASLYAGQDLGLGRPEPISSLEFPQSDLVGQAMLTPGGSADLANGLLTVEFPELDQWSGFQVSHAPGRRVLLVAGMLVLVGLIPSLYSYRRRLWVEARRDGERTDVVLAGVALQRQTAFADEFAEVRDTLEAALAGPAPLRHAPAVPTPQKETRR
jgi:cytochrome c biogenesis protein